MDQPFTNFKNRNQEELNMGLLQRLRRKSTLRKLQEAERIFENKPFCEIHGHQWQTFTHSTFDYYGNEVRYVEKYCKICGKTEQIGKW